MKKSYLLLILILTSCASLKYLKPFDSFKNTPKQVEVIKYKINNQDSISKEELAYKDIYYYDSKGRKIKNLTYKSDGTQSSKGWYFFYDKQGNEITNILYNLDSIIIIQNNYKYNKYGQKIEREHISYGKKSVTQYTFQRDKKLSYIIGKKSDGSFKENAVLKYDKKWRQIELISYDKVGKQKTRIKFQYDERGNKIISKWYNSKNILYDISKTIFNKKNDPIWAGGIVIKGKDTITEKGLKFKYKYDKHYNIIEEKLYSKNGKVSWITRSKFTY